jgi:hypothetical protein
MAQHSVAQHRSTQSLRAGSEAVCLSTVCNAIMTAWLEASAAGILALATGGCQCNQQDRHRSRGLLTGMHANKSAAYPHTMCTAQMQVHTCCLCLGIVTGCAVIVQTGLLHGGLRMASATDTHTRLITPCLTVSVQLRPRCPTPTSKNCTIKLVPMRSRCGLPPRHAAAQPQALTVLMLHAVSASTAATSNVDLRCCCRSPPGWHCSCCRTLLHLGC